MSGAPRPWACREPLGRTTRAEWSSGSKTIAKIILIRIRYSICESKRLASSQELQYPITAPRTHPIPLMSWGAAELTMIHARCSLLFFHNGQVFKALQVCIEMIFKRTIFLARSHVMHNNLRFFSKGNYRKSRLKVVKTHSHNPYFICKNRAKLGCWKIALGFR